MDVREKLVEIVKKAAYSSLPSNTEDFHLNMFVTNLLAHGVTVQELDGCEHCRTASYTEKPFVVITQMGRKVKTRFNFCPNCGRKLPQPPKGE